MSLELAVKEMYRLKAERNWDKLYFAIDLHGTIIEPGRLKKLNVYHEAQLGLQFLTERPEIVLILFTSTLPSMLTEFYSWCELNQIKFDYFNENPECVGHNRQGDYTRKFYFNLVLDDRAGFNYKEDWNIVVGSIVKYSLLTTLK